jgi:hypothetical protein
MREFMRKKRISFNYQRVAEILAAYPHSETERSDEPMENIIEQLLKSFEWLEAESRKHRTAIDWSKVIPIVDKNVADDIWYTNTEEERDVVVKIQRWLRSQTSRRGACRGVRI